MEREAQRGTRLRPFDPTEHEGETTLAFEKFLRLFNVNTWPGIGHHLHLRQILPPG